MRIVPQRCSCELPEKGVKLNLKLTIKESIAPTGNHLVGRRHVDENKNDELFSLCVKVYGLLLCFCPPQ